jgi:hypothetical protein
MPVPLPAGKDDQRDTAAGAGVLRLRPGRHDGGQHGRQPECRGGEQPLDRGGRNCFMDLSRWAKATQVQAGARRVTCCRQNM